MALKKFIGARYAPEFAGAWSNTKQYAALSVVYTNNRSYVSRKTVPAGTPITNTEFWIQSSDWNAQVAEYNLKVEGYNANVEQYNRNVQDYSAAVSGFYADTLHSFDTKADMQADRTLALGETLLTCGDKKIGDGGGSFYQVVSETSVTAVALDNGLFAEPFEFQPYDYSQFQQEVEGYKKSTTRVYQNVADMTADTNISVGDTLMTNGRTVAGDGKGRFWTVSDEAAGNATRLDNGKYAKPFQLASVDTANMLVFNGTGAQPAIWGIKEGSGMITIPVLLEEGDIKTVYVAVEYTTGGQGATVNLDISGTQSFNKQFVFNESAPAEGTYKTVLYAITAKAEGGKVFTGSSAVTSYNTTLSEYSAIISVGVPDNSNARWEGIKTNLIGGTSFTVSRRITLKSIHVNTYGFADEAQHRFEKIQIFANNVTAKPSTAVFNTGKLDVTNNAIDKDIEIDAVLEPGITYTMYIAAFTKNRDPGYMHMPTILDPGIYGPFTFTSVIQYNGIIKYTTE